MSDDLLELSDAIREQARPSVLKTPPPCLSKPADLEEGLARVSESLRPLQIWLVNALSSPQALAAPLGEDAVTKLHALMAYPPQAPLFATPLALAVVQAHGPGPVLEALVTPRPLVATGVNDAAGRSAWLVPAPPEEPGKVMVHAAETWLPQLQPSFDAATEEERATWRAHVQQHRPALPLELRVALSGLFRDTAWAEEDAATFLAAQRAHSGRDRMIGALLPHLDRDDLFEALAKQAGGGLYQTPVYAEIIVRPPAARALKRLVRLLEWPLARDDQRQAAYIVIALACSRAEEAADGIASAALLVRERAKDYFFANPQLLPVLAARGKGRGRNAESLRAMVTEIERKLVAASSPSSGELPPVLAAPPWLARQPPWPSRTVEMIIDGERVIETGALVLAREALSQRSTSAEGKSEAEVLVKLQTKKLLLDRDEFAALSDEVALANIHRLKAFSLITAVARFGVQAIPALARLMWEKPLSTHVELLEVLRSPRLATVASYHEEDTWLFSDPENAALGLIPGLFVEDPGRRHWPERGVLRLCAAGYRAEVSKSAARYGEEVARAVEEVLERDPAQRLPHQLPILHVAFTNGSLPLLETKEGPLPAAVIPTVGMYLAVGPMWLPHPALAELRQLCTPASLDAFAWALYERGQLDALAHLGGDGPVRKLDALLSAPRMTFSPEGRRARLNALARNGSPLALVLLEKHALLSPYADREAYVEGLFEGFARARGVTRAQLEDDAFGGLDVARELPVLDYGPRSFRVTLDNHLVPRLADETGKPLPKLPKPTKKDDAAKAEQVKAQLEALKLDLDDVRETLLTYFERAMTTERTFESARFRSAVVSHPLLVQEYARRLVWASGDHVFRIAEDGTLADVDDQELELAPDAAIRIAHPVEMSAETLTRLRQLFTDYEIIQPFPQLERPFFPLTDEERASSRLVRFAGQKIGTFACPVLLGSPAWHRRSNDLRKKHGTYLSLTRSAASGDLEVWEGCDLLRDGGGEAPFSVLTAVEVSELLRDLAALAWVE